MFASIFFVLWVMVHAILSFPVTVCSLVASFFELLAWFLLSHQSHWQEGSLLPFIAKRLSTFLFYYCIVLLFFTVEMFFAHNVPIFTSRNGRLFVDGTPFSAAWQRIQRIEKNVSRVVSAMFAFKIPVQNVKWYYEASRDQWNTAWAQSCLSKIRLCLLLQVNSVLLFKTDILCFAFRLC